MNKLMLMLLGLTLIGCASAPSQEEMANADYGSYQSPENCVLVAESKIRSTLKDPSSAQFSHGRCYQGYWSSVPILGMKAAFGYMQQGTVNAKNSYGGYVGARSYNALIQNGYVVRYCVANNDGLCMATN